MDHALAYLMMVDNTGPQNSSQVIEGWANVAQVTEINNNRRY